MKRSLNHKKLKLKCSNLSQILIKNLENKTLSLLIRNSIQILIFRIRKKDEEINQLKKELYSLLFDYSCVKKENEKLKEELKTKGTFKSFKEKNRYLSSDYSDHKLLRQESINHLASTLKLKRQKTRILKKILIMNLMIS